MGSLDAPAVPTPEQPRPQHVWINLGTPAYPQNDMPGLLTEWRRRRDGWEALCIWGTEGGGWHSGWLDQRKLWPAGSVPRDRSDVPPV